VKPPAFRYAAPDSLEETLALLAEHGAEATLLAGGQSLVPLLNLRVVRPGVVLDLNRVPGLDGCTVNGDVRLGALVRQQDALRNAALGAAAPLLTTALGAVGHVASRSRGTIAGSLAHADPAAELPAVLLALDGSVSVRSASGTRSIGAAELFTGPFSTALRRDEVLVEVWLPRAAPGVRVGFHEIARRQGDFALAGAACRLEAPAGKIERAAIALFGVAGNALRAPLAEIALTGTSLGDPAAAEEAATLAVRGLDPADDIHASGAYRRRMAGVAVRRALEQAGAADA
jgi:carbon-monoxide dehydrogenase medium subunit